MRKWLRVVLIAGGSLLGLLILLLLGLAWYINANKSNFLKQITGQLNDRISGNLTIGDMEPSLFRSFPNVSLALKKVVLKDSLWQRHRHALVDVDYIFVRVNTLSLLRRYVDVKEVSLQNGSIYLYTDTTGYTNTTALQGNGGGKKSGSKDADIKMLNLEHITFELENEQKFKRFTLEIKQLSGKVQAADSGIHADIRSEILAKNFAFNTTKGSYLKNKTLGLNLSLFFKRQTRQLEIPQQEMRIDGQPVMITGRFNFSEKPPPFYLKINATQVLLKDAASWLSPSISSKLGSINLSAPLDAEAILNGHLKYRDTPNVLVTWKTTNNVLITTMGEWTHCSFTGRFNNEIIPGAGHNDENSAVNIFGLQASLNSVPLKADTIRVVNLKHPLLHGHFQSQFPLANLNSAAEDIPILFKEGNARADLYYSGPVLKDDNTPSSLQGIVEVQQGAFNYLPRDLTFRNCNATLRFQGQDLQLERVTIQSQKSTLKMEGTIKNMLNFYFSAPEKIALNWKITSPLVDLNEFRSFLVARKKGKKPVNKKVQGGKVARQLDAVLDASNVRMQVLLDKVIYANFTAQQVAAELSLTKTDVLINKISLQSAGGSAQVSGIVHPQGNNNTFKINAAVTNMHIGQLFYAFDNFGMESLTSKNLKGIVSAKTNIRGNILDNGTMAKHSLFGSINFSLKNGALIDFAPLADIGNFVFRRRRLDSITFENLSNTFQVEGNKILIPPMRIASSAVNIDVNGVYGINGGTDIKLDVPLRNPAKDSAITDKAEKERRSRKGIIVHLRAVSEKDGKVKIKLGKGN
ncbi:AsmA-like C-terminal region-containing protein [Chitinophaga solisilvae]|uniref:AsmA-like C-terminal region-containing protein n=1 Tax=Chitinophaga solisilvae TaxID=1233460 RepID=UPI001368AC44|nr:AsmA-like C-terminal region-containing protein [Chitinophaga solisilvae]